MTMFDHPEVTLSGWLDIKTQQLTNWLAETDIITAGGGLTSCCVFTPVIPSPFLLVSLLYLSCDIPSHAAGMGMNGRSLNAGRKCAQVIIILKPAVWDVLGERSPNKSMMSLYWLIDLSTELPEDSPNVKKAW